MSKQRLFSVDSLLTTLKAIAVNIVVYFIPFLLLWLIGGRFPMFANVATSIWVLFSLVLWGFVANRFWGWR